MRRLVLLGLNHTTAPLAVREKLAFTPAQRDAALAALAGRFPKAEAVLLSTCNRVELYVARPVHESPRPDEAADFLADFHGLDPAVVRPHLYEKTDEQVVRHLFTVAASLDSMVLGEAQILGQVRDAYDAARAAGRAGAGLHTLFQKAIGVGKLVRSSTAIADGRLSVASVAVDYARQVFERFDDKTVLTIGAGKMATLALRHFADLKPGRLLVCNRDVGKAEMLAGRFGGAPCDLGRLGEWLVAADVVISSTGSAAPIITRKLYEGLLRQRRYRPALLIDIALPRDVEESVADLDGVYLYNLDDLQQVVAGTRENRAGALAAASDLIERELREYHAAARQREMGPVIEQLYARGHAIAQAELSRTMGKLGELSPEQRQQVEELARRLVNKLLHEPVQNLRGGERPEASGTGQLHYLHAVQKLFGLEEPPATKAQDEQTGRQ